MERLPVLAVLAAAFAAFGASEARAGVDAEVPANLRAKGTLAPEGDMDVWRFQATAGDLLTFKLVAAGGVDLLFDAVLVAPDGTILPLGGAVQKGKTLSVSKLALPASGEWRLEVTATGTGDYSLQLKANVKGLKALSVDARAKTLGRPGGGETYLRRVMGPAGGTMAVDDADGDLDGASLTIPGGALAGTVGVVISSKAAGGDPPAGTRAAGPVFAVGPAGLDLGTGTLLLLPFDDAQVPAQGTAADLRVALRDPKTPPDTVAPQSVDEVGGTLAILLDRGCEVCAVAQDTMPAIVGTGSPAEYWLLSLGAGLETDPTNNDSRGRRFEMAIGEVEMRTDGSGSMSLDNRWWSFKNREVPPGPGQPSIDPGFDYGSNVETGDFTWDYTADGQGILIGGSPDAPVFRSSVDGSLLVGRNEAPNWAKGGLNLCLRKEPVSGPGALSGTWNVVLLNFGAMGNSGNGPADFSIMRGTGTVTFDGVGGAKTAVSMRDTRWDGSAWRSVLQNFSASTDYVVGEDGTVLLDLRTPADDKAPVFRLRFGPRADVLVGMDQAQASSGGVTLLGVRQGKGMGPADLTGQYRGSDFGVSPQTYNLSPQQQGLVTIPDFSTWDQWLDGTFNGTRTATVAGAGPQYRRDTTVAGGVRQEEDSFSAAMSLSLGKTGKGSFVDPEGHVMTGLVSPDGSVVFILTSPGDANGDDTFGALVKVPSTPQGP
jgi:hypothetical protein